MKHPDILAKLTIKEKAAMLSGASEWTSRACERLGISSLFFADGPHGIRRQEGAGDHLGLNASLKATCFPTAAAIADSWDTELADEVGKALGQEAASQGVDVLLGPGLNIKRSPLCGRNFEYYSEDPYLSGKLAGACVRGIQSQGVSACVKHFAVNSQEERRMAMNAVVDERTLREIYLTGFEMAVKEGGARAVMTSYNEVNGVYANENRHLLLDILRGEWGFEGLVVTDWGGSNDHVEAVRCRSDIEMPGPGLEPARELLEALEEGRLSMEELDACVDDVLDAVLWAEEHRRKGVGLEEEAHHLLAKKAARESIVLLKNEGREGEKLLPLKKGCRVALIGDFARTPRYQGAGSSLVNATCIESMEQQIEKYPITCIGMAEGYDREGGEDAEKRKEALLLAQRAEVVLYCFGLPEISESEGTDRSHMRIPENQVVLLRELFRVNRNIVGILSTGSAIEMPWHTCLRALVHGALGGQAGAGAMLDVLTGRYNPSGRLAETYPVSYEDTPASPYYPAKQRNAEYREGIYVGYRYYETVGARVQFPFGFGLSYTEFAYSELKVEEEGISLTVENTGKADGAEVVQLYVKGPEGAVFRPDRELKGFVKVFLTAGEKKRVQIPFDDKTFRYWNVKTGRFEVEEGTYQILVGSSVKDIRLTGSCFRRGTTQELPYRQGTLLCYACGLVHRISDREYENLLGAVPQEKAWSGELHKNDAICQMYYAKSFLARLVWRILENRKKKSEAQGKPDLNILFIYNMPFRAIAKMTHGAVGMEMVEGMLSAVNGHFFRGLGKIVTGWFRNRNENKAYEQELENTGQNQ